MWYQVYNPKEGGVGLLLSLIGVVEIWVSVVQIYHLME